MRGRRLTLRHKGKALTLQPGSSRLLRQLVAARAAGAGWIPVPQTHAGRKGVSRLRGEFQELDPEGRSWIENDGRGRYRLTAACPPINLSTDQGETP